jgi:hypothetical protein
MGFGHGARAPLGYEVWAIVIGNAQSLAKRSVLIADT